jgi:hypothetical protein
MRAWVDQASYQDLLQKWRFAPAGSPWFAGAMGTYYSLKMQEKKAALTPGQQVAASKAVGLDPS